MKINYLVYHDSCLDGFLSGMIAYYKAKFMGVKNLVVVPANYSDTPIDPENAESVVLVDFSYPMPFLLDYMDKGIHVTVVDHHKTFIDSFLSFDEGLQHPDLLTKQWSKREQEHYMTYHPVSGRPLFTNMDIKVDDQIRSNFSFYLNNNEIADKNSERVHSGASLCFHIATSESVGEAVKQILVEKTGGDIYETVRLARTHDLWLHKGDEKSDAYALSHWFKKFHKANRDYIEEMKTSPDKSAEMFEHLLEAFNNTGLFNKIAAGEEDLAALAEQLEALSKSDAVKEVQLKLSHPEGVRVCYVEGEEAKRLGISIVGSFMVTKKGWDVAIMDAVSNDEKHVYSLRSNEQGSNVDVSAICQSYFKADLALSGGGHKNAAGVAFAADKKDAFFSVLSENSTEVVNLKIDKELHASIVRLAAEENKTVDEWLVEILEIATFRDQPNAETGT